MEVIDSVQGAGRSARATPHPKVDAPPARTNGLTRIERGAYGVGQFAEGVENTALSIFGLFFYNQVLGLPASLAGLAFGISLVLDAVLDPLIGSLSDRVRSRYGRRHPFLFLAAIPLAASFVLVFCPPAGLGQSGLFAWLLGTIIAARVALSLYHIPHIALGSELSSDFDERTTVVAYRQFASTLGGMCAFALGFGWFFAATSRYPVGQLNASAYRPYALSLAVLMGFAGMACAWGTRGRIDKLYAPAAAPPRRLQAVLWQAFEDVVTVLRLKGFRALFVGLVILGLVVGVVSSLNLYMYTYFWRLSSGQLLWLYVIYPAGFLTGAALTPWLKRHFEKRSILIGACLVWGINQVGPICLELLGVLPTPGSQGLLIALCVATFIQGLGVVQASVVAGSMIADLSDEQQLYSGARSEGVLFSAQAFATKATVGLGSIVAGVILDLIGWPTHAKMIAAPSDDALLRLALACGPAMGLVLVLSLILFKDAGLSRASHGSIARLLNERNGASQ